MHEIENGAQAPPDTPQTPPSATKPPSILLASLLPTIPLPPTTASLRITGLSSSPAKVLPGHLFAAWDGPTPWGHDPEENGYPHIPTAISRGAAAILCGRPIDCGDTPCIVVSDVRETVALAARRFYRDPAADMTMVGITGTNGKTTTAFLVEALLKASGRCVGVVGSLGCRVDGGVLVETGYTTPQATELMEVLAGWRDRGADAVVMEVSSHGLAERRVGGVAFDVGVYTNFTMDHLVYHGDMETYFAAKQLLFTERLKGDAVAVVNADDPALRNLSSTAQRTIFYSVDATSQADVRAQRITTSPTGLSLEIFTPRGPLHITSPLIGLFNASNILAAVAVAEALHLPHPAITHGISSMHGVSTLR